MTFEDVINMIYSVRPHIRREAVFVCDHATAQRLRMLEDHEGGLVWQEGWGTSPQPRIFGYPIRADVRYAGLAFGPFAELPVESATPLTQQGERPVTASERIERLEAAVSAIAELLLNTNPHIAERLADIIIVLNTPKEGE